MRLLFTLALGCASPPTSGSAPAPGVLDPRSQYDLLDDIVTAERDGGAAAFHAVRDRWQGRTFRWELYWLPELCRTPAGPCNAVPFDSARLDGVNRQGFLPRLDLAPDEHARLVSQCAPHAGCVITVEGTLGTFRFARDEYTRLGLSDVVVRSARARRDDEHWGRRHAPGHDGLGEVRRRARELLEQGYRPTLRAMPREEG